MKLVTSKISKKELIDIAKERFEDMVKVVVDIELGIMTVGGELHADEEAMLLEGGSKQKNLWGINIYVDKANDETSLEALDNYFFQFGLIAAKKQ